MSDGYKSLTVWQKSVDLVVEAYKLTAKLPVTERYGLCSQMQRAAVSISANIAEGSRRKTAKEFKYFLSVCYGSGAELETYLILLKKLYDVEPVLAAQLLSEVMAMLNRMLGYSRT